MLDILDSGEGVIKDDVYDHTRWSVIHELIFKFEEKIYRTTYSVGATEYQDEGPWDYVDMVECIEVKPVEKTIIVYEPIK